MFAPDPTGGAYSASPDPSWLRGLYFKGGEEKGRGKAWEGPAPFRRFLDPPLLTALSQTLAGFKRTYFGMGRGEGRGLITHGPGTDSELYAASTDAHLLAVKSQVFRKERQNLYL